MTEITTVAELDALPVGAEVRDKDYDVWVKLPSGGWGMLGRPGSSAAHLAELWAPLTVTARLHMTRCCMADCTTTIPLPPGSAWACPDHGDEHHNITLGGS